MMTLTIPAIVARWSDPSRRPLFKGQLIDISPDGTVCRCAQGDILHLAGWSDERLAQANQFEADAAVAALLGISRTHSVLLRHINDSADGCPQDVLTAPERVLGPHAHLVLAFWRHLDTMTEDDWLRVVVAVKDAPEDAAKAATWAARDAWDAWNTAKTGWDALNASDAGWTPARAAAWDATVGTREAAWAAAAASNEIQGHEHLAAPLVFLPMFGLTINDLSEAA